jgi:hypothetical protein
MHVTTVVIDQTQITVEVPEFVVEVALAVLNEVSAALIHPLNPLTLITWDADGGMTIKTNTRLTIKNTVTGDEVTY